MKRLSELVVTFFYVGKIPFAPGTWGSLAGLGFLLGYGYSILAMFRAYNNMVVGYKTVLGIMAITLIILLPVGLFAAGWYFGNKYLEYKGKEDHQEIVIDEVVGQMLTVFLAEIVALFVTSVTHKMEQRFWLVIFLSFISFRLFDIWKPWPVSWADKRKTALFIMLDDVLAAVYASFIPTFVIYFLCLVGVLEFSQPVP